MENISKALLISAGVMLGIMLLSVIFIFGNQMAAYFSEKHNSKMIEQLVEFNDKFQNYNGEVIRGNELVSIMNRIVDYNAYQSDMVGYERIKITIKLKNHHNELKYGNETGGSTLITGSTITNEINDEIIKKIATTSSRVTSYFGIAGLTDTKLQKMSANIEHIVDDEVVDSRAKDEYIKYREQILSRILGYTITQVNNSDLIEDAKKATYQYYQYTMFKRAMFECTNVSYNETNGRVNRMDFEVVLEEGDSKIKFD